MTRRVAPVPETVVRLRVNGFTVTTWTCSPGDPATLAAGRLLALGFIDSGADLEAVEVGEDSGVMVIETRVVPVRAAAGIDEREHRRERGCGLRHFLDCQPDALTSAAAPAAPPPSESFRDLFRDLFDRSPSRQTTGGHHTAALSDGSTLRYVHEEVGRHNAIDRSIGAAVLDGADRAAMAALGLITTARISGEMAEHAARAGIGWIASRSVPTTLAVEIAAAAGIPVIARAPGPDARIVGGEA